jgi:hypothetical protein
VLLTRHRDGRDIIEAASGCAGLLERRPPGVRTDLSAAGVRCAPVPDQRTGLLIADNNLARLSGRVDSRDQRHGDPFRTGFNHHWLAA